MSQSLTDSQVKAARTAMTLLRHLIAFSDEICAEGEKERSPRAQEHYDRAVDILKMWDEPTPEEQSLSEAIGLGIGGRGVAEY